MIRQPFEQQQQLGALKSAQTAIAFVLHVREEENNAF